MIVGVAVGLVVGAVAVGVVGVIVGTVVGVVVGVVVCFCSRYNGSCGIRCNYCCVLSRALNVLSFFFGCSVGSCRASA